MLRDLDTLRFPDPYPYSLPPLLPFLDLVFVYLSSLLSPNSRTRGIVYTTMEPTRFSRSHDEHERERELTLALTLFMQSLPDKE